MTAHYIKVQNKTFNISKLMNYYMIKKIYFLII